MRKELKYFLWDTSGMTQRDRHIIQNISLFETVHTTHSSLRKSPNCAHHTQLPLKEYKLCTPYTAPSEEVFTGIIIITPFWAFL